MSYLPYLIAASSGLFISLFLSFINVCASLFCHRKLVDTVFHVRTIDDYISKRGHSQVTSLAPFAPPRDGVCWWFDGGLVIAVRCTVRGDRSTRTTYDLFIFGAKGVARVKKLLYGDSQSIMVTHVDYPHLHRGDITTTPYDCKNKPNLEQKKIVKSILAAYNDRSKGHSVHYASALICGPPGCGKTEIAFLVARELLNRGVIPIVNVIDLTTRGMSPNDTFDSTSSAQPAIILMDEYDRAISHAEDGKNKSDGKSIAENKSSLCEYLDRIARVNHVIVIATTNLDIGVITGEICESAAASSDRKCQKMVMNGEEPECRCAKKDSAYTRKGRIDMKFIVKEKINKNRSV